MPDTTVPAPRVPFYDVRTGMMTREWFLFFQELYSRTGGTNGLDGDKGDITVSNNGATMTIDAEAVSTTQLGGDITSLAKNILDDETGAEVIATIGLTATTLPITVTTIADWPGNVEPDDTGDAIDKLAMRVKDIEDDSAASGDSTFISIVKWGLD